MARLHGVLRLGGVYAMHESKRKHLGGSMAVIINFCKIANFCLGRAIGDAAQRLLPCILSTQSTGVLRCKAATLIVKRFQDLGRFFEFLFKRSHKKTRHSRVFCKGALTD